MSYYTSDRNIYIAFVGSEESLCVFFRIYSYFHKCTEIPVVEKYQKESVKEKR